MALTKNLSTTANGNLFRNFFGKYDGIGSVVGFAAGLQKVQEEDDSSLRLDLSYDEFFNRIYSATKQHTLAYRVLWHNSGTCVVPLPRFLLNKRKFEVIGKPDIFNGDFPYCDSTTFFTKTVEEFKAASIVGNGNQVFTSNDQGFLFRIFGSVFIDGVEEFVNSSNAAPGLPSIQHNVHMDTTTSWTFIDAGPPLSGHGLGGMTPVLFEFFGQGVKKYGGLDDPDANVIKSDAYDALLKYDGGGGPRIFAGKHLFAYKGPNSSMAKDEDIALIIMCEDGGLGFNIDEVRDELFDKGFEFVVGMDGSSSVFLYEGAPTPTYHIGRQIKNLFREAGQKNVTNVLRTGYGIVE